jgi:hypothetical protein
MRFAAPSRRERAGARRKRPDSAEAVDPFPEFGHPQRADVDDDQQRRDVVGLGQVALNSAPVFGGLMLAVAAGQFRGPDYRELIKQDMDLLDRLPPEAIARRAELQRTINDRVDDLVDVADRNRALRKAAVSYRGNWRDVVVLLCVVLFTIIWWEVDHSRGNWLPMFILLILLSVVTAAYAFRGVLRSASSLVRPRPHARDRQDRLRRPDTEK